MFLDPSFMQFYIRPKTSDNDFSSKKRPKSIMLIVQPSLFPNFGLQYIFERYQLMRGICPIPKSIFPHELEANLKLTEEDWQLTEQQCKDIG